MQIGERLREAREFKNLTLDDIQAVTKIQKRYLVAIEHDDFHVLPGRFYARAFIKEYANAVDLDPDELLIGFDEDKVAQEEETVRYSRLDRSRRANAGKSSSIFSFLPSVIVVLLIVSIILVAWTLYQKTLSAPTGDPIEDQDKDEIIQRDVGDEQRDPEPDSDSNEGQSESPAQNAVGEDEEDDNTETFTVVEEGTGKSPESIIDYTNNHDGVIVTLKATENSYVQVKGEAGTTYVDRLFTPGVEEEFDLSSEERIYFNVGHVPGMTILINNEQLEFPVDANQSVHQKVWLNIK